MKYNKSKLLILLSCILLGVLLASQVSTGKVVPREIMTFQNYQQVSAEIRKLTDEISVLSAKKDELELNIMQYQFASQSDSKKIDKFVEEIQKFEYYNGLTDVEGPGVTIYLTDNPMEHLDVNVPREIAPAELVHDEYIRKIVWQLKNAGAEAISVNDQRVMSNTEFRCEGPVIRINNIGFAPPYRIKAIGDPEVLAFALNDANDEHNAYKEVEATGVVIGFQKESSIIVKKYQRSISPLYMKPVQEDK